MVVFFLIPIYVSCLHVKMGIILSHLYMEYIRFDFFSSLSQQMVFLCVFFSSCCRCTSFVLVSPFFKSMNFVKKIYKHAYKLYNDFNAVATHIQFDFPSVLKVLSYMWEIYFSFQINRQRGYGGSTSP